MVPGCEHGDGTVESHEFSPGVDVSPLSSRGGIALGAKGLQTSSWRPWLVAIVSNQGYLSLPYGRIAY